MKSNPYYGPLTLLAAVLIFSTNGFWQAIAPEGATPYVVAASRLWIGGLTLALWCLVRYRKIHLRGWNWKAIGTYAVALWLYQIFFFQGVYIIGVAVGTVIAVGSTPIFTGLIQALIYKERPDSLWYIATLFAIIGLVLVNMVDAMSFSWYAVILPLLAGLTLAISVIVAAEVAKVHSAEEGMAIVMLLAAALMLPFFMLFPVEWMATPKGMLCVAMLGIVNSALAFTLELIGFKNTPTLIASTLTLGEPMGAALIGIFVLNEPSTLASVSGIVLLFISILILVIGPEFKRRLKDNACSLATYQTSTRP